LFRGGADLDGSVQRVTFAVAEARAWVEAVDRCGDGEVHPLEPTAVDVAQGGIVAVLDVDAVDLFDKAGERVTEEVDVGFQVGPGETTIADNVIDVIHVFHDHPWWETADEQHNKRKGE